LIDVETSANQKRGLVVVTLPLSYDSARRLCVTLDGDLASITSQQQVNDTLRLLVDASSKLSNVWMGLRRQSPATSYQWDYLGIAQLFNMLGIADYKY
jgi:hypothetical protein